MQNEYHGMPQEHSVTLPAKTLPSDTGGDRDDGMSQEERIFKLPAPPQTRHSASQGSEEIRTDDLKDTFLRKFSITPEGGHVHLKEVGVFLLVPPGALTETTEMFIGISLREEDMPPLPPCQTRASPVVVCGPHGLTFRKPVYLSFYHCISGTRQRKRGKICPESLTQNSRMDNPFYVWQSETHLNAPCQWKVLSSDSAVLTNTKCVLNVNQFCKHSLSCDSKRLSALVFGSFQPQHVPLLTLMVCCVNDIRNEVENVTTNAKESLQMEMLALEKQFHFLTCEYSESEDKESYNVSLSLDGYETEWDLRKGCHKKVNIKYVKLLKNKTEHVTYALNPKMTDELDVLDCKIQIKQEVSEDQEEDIKELTSTEFDIHWKLPQLFKTSKKNSDLGESSHMGGTSLVKTTQKKRKYSDDDDDDDSSYHSNKLTPSNTAPAKRKNVISTKKLKTSDDEGEQLRQGPVSGQQREKQGDANYQKSGHLVHESPPFPVNDHCLEEQGALLFQTRRKSGHDFPPLPPQQNPVAAEDPDQGVTEPQTTRTMGNQVLNQAHGDNQLEQLSTTVTQGIAGVLRKIPANTGNMHITLVHQVNHNYNSEKASMTHMKEKDVTIFFHKHVPPRVRKRLNETLSQDEVWDQVKKMYDIPDETPRPPDVVSSLLSQVYGSIASFICVLLKLRERHKEGQQYIPHDLIDEVKDGLKSEMEYKKLRQNKIRFAEELHIDIGRILDYFNQDDIVQDEEITVLKNTAKENPRDASRKLFERLLASSPDKRPIKYLKDALRQCQHWHLADELEVSKHDVEDELQKHGGGRPSSEESLAIGT